MKIIFLTGVQGTGKTVASKIINSMKNPKIAAKDLDEFVVRRTFKKNEFENFIEEQEKIFKERC